MQSFFQTLVSGLSFGAVYALVALGFSLVYRTMGLVNFAHGAVLMIGAYVASTFYLSARLPFAAAVPIAMAVTGAIGLLIERVLRPLENKAVAVAAGGPGNGLLGLATSLPAPPWLIDHDLDGASAALLRKTAPRPGDVSSAPNEPKRSPILFVSRR